MASLRLTVLGWHVPLGAWWLLGEDGTMWVGGSSPMRGALGPLLTEAGPLWLVVAPRSRSLWSVIGAHPDGLSESAVVAALRALVAKEGAASAPDPDETWIGDDGEVLIGARGGAWSSLARYLLGGETAHGIASDEPGWVSELDEDLGTLDGLSGDPAAWTEVVQACAPDEVVPRAPWTGRTLVVGAAAPAPSVGPSAPPKALMARSGALMLVLGLATGWIVGGAPGSTIDLEILGASSITVSCADVRIESSSARLTVPTRPLVCEVEAALPSGVVRTTLDMGRGGKYECAVLRGEVQCDGV